jgi:S1-C subfamily serine protease
MDHFLDRELKRRFLAVFHGKFVEPETGFTQTSLYPIAWSYPKNTNHQVSRFGVVGDDAITPKAVTITSVEANGPAENIMIYDKGQKRSGSLQKGDAILSISDEEVEDADSFSYLVRLSPKTISFTFKRNGEEHYAEATLRW